MHRLSFLTNIIPVIAKCDTLSASETVALKTSVLARLQTSPVRPFLFGIALDDALLAAQGLAVVHPASTSIEPEQYPFSTPTFPHVVSSTSGPDNETMDASLLMSPDYVQPLLPSELTALVSQVFDPESITWLRHSAAKKMLTWRKRTILPSNSLILQSLQQARSPTIASGGFNGVPFTGKISHDTYCKLLVLTHHSISSLLHLHTYFTFRRSSTPVKLAFLLIHSSIALSPRIPVLRKSCAFLPRTLQHVHLERPIAPGHPHRKVGNGSPTFPPQRTRSLRGRSAQRPRKVAARTRR